MSSSTIGRLFVSLEGDTGPLNTALLEAIGTVTQFGNEIDKAGQNYIKTFVDALNPTLALTDQINLLTAAGQSEADIVSVLGDKLIAASQAATDHGQAISPLIQHYTDLAQAQTDLAQAQTDLAQAQDDTGGSLESLGQALTDFAKNPVEGAKNAISGFLESLGPAVAGLAGIGVAVVAAGAGLVEFVKGAANAQIQLDALSAQTGYSVQDLQALKIMAADVGEEGTNFARTLGMLNKELAQGDSSPFVKAMDKLGVSVTDTNGDSRDAVSILDDLRVKLLDIEDPTLRAQAANEALGGRLRDLIPLVVNTKDSISDWKDQIEAAGATTDVLTQQKLREFHDMMYQVELGATAVKNVLVTLAVDGLDFLGRGIEAEVVKWETMIDGFKTFISMIPNLSIQWNGVIPTLTVNTDKFTGSMSEMGSVGADATAKLASSVQGLSDKMTKEQQAALAAQEESIKLREEFENQIAPLDALATKYGEFAAQGGSLTQFVTMHTAAIISAGKAQIKLTGILSSTDAELMNQALQAQHAAEQTKELKTQYDDAQKATDSYEKSIVGLGLSFDDMMQRVRDFHDNALNFGVDFAKAMADLSDGFDHTQIVIDDDIDKMIAKNEAWVDNIKTHNPLDSITKGLEKIDVDKDWKAFNDTMVNHASATTLAMQAEFANLGKGISDDLAKSLIEWEDPAGAILKTLKGVGEKMLSTIVSSFMDPFIKLFTEHVLDPLTKQLSSWIDSAITAIKGVFSSANSGLGSEDAGSSTGGSGGINGTEAAVGAAAGAGTAIAGLFSTGVKGWLETIGGGAAIGASIGAYFGPMAAAIGAAIGAAAGAIAKGIEVLVQGKDAFTAGTEELGRDFGDLQMTSGQLKTFISSIGLTEDAFWNIRKDIESSPKFLVEVAYPLAEAQGKVDAFVNSLKNVTTAWGTFNFADAFNLGEATGDWTALNKAFDDAFSKSGALVAAMPNFAATLNETSTATDTLGGKFQTLYEAFVKSGTGLSDLETYVNANKDALTALGVTMPTIATELSSLGTAFKLQDLQNFANELSTTGVISQQFSDFIVQNGGDLTDFNAIAANMPGLAAMQTGFSAIKTAIDKLIPSVQSCYDQFISTGIITDDLAAKITAAGGDIQTFKDYTDMKSVVDNFDGLVSSFKSTGIATTDLINDILTYGGTTTDVANLSNANIDSIAANVKDNLSAAYTTAAQKLSDELGTMNETLQQSIDALNKALTTAIDKLIAAIQGLAPATATAVTNMNSSLNDIAVPDIGSALIDSYSGAVDYIGDNPIDFGGSGGKLDASGVPSFQRGGTMPYTGLAHLEAGEVVLPPGAISGGSAGAGVGGGGVTDLAASISALVTALGGLAQRSNDLTGTIPQLNGALENFAENANQLYKGLNSVSLDDPSSYMAAIAKDAYNLGVWAMSFNPTLDTTAKDGVQLTGALGNFDSNINALYKGLNSVSLDDPNSYMKDMATGAYNLGMWALSFNPTLTATTADAHNLLAVLEGFHDAVNQLSHGLGSVSLDDPASYMATMAKGAYNLGMWALNFNPILSKTWLDGQQLSAALENFDANVNQLYNGLSSVSLGTLASAITSYTPSNAAISLPPNVASLLGSVPGFQHGGDVQRTGLIYAHAGEHVTPAGQSRGDTYVFQNHGTIVGVNDVDAWIAQSIQRTLGRGGLRA